MAIIYVRSTDGNDGDSGASWALAKATLAGADGIDAAGDTIYVSQNHAESAASSFTPSWQGTLTAPTKVICANDGAQPPTASATSATVTTTGASNIVLQNGGKCFSFYGITFNCGTGTGSQTLRLGTVSLTPSQYFEACNFKLISTGASGIIDVSSCVIVNCGFQLNNAAQKISVAGPVLMRGGSILAGGTSPTYVFDFTAGARSLIEGFDFSNCSAGVNLCNVAGASVVADVTFRDCKLPASWSGALVNAVSSMHPMAVVQMINCSAGSQNYKYWRQTYYGSIVDESTVVMTGGATDGTTPISRKMVSTSSTAFLASPLESQQLFAWNETVGSPVTATVEIVTDNVTLKDDEAYLELLYLGSSSVPVATRITDAKSDVLGSASNQTSSSVTWTTTGLTTPVKQKLSATFTPQMKGLVVARVILAKPSTTLYFDPSLILS